jgi:hypothetical protein
LLNPLRDRREDFAERIDPEQTTASLELNLAIVNDIETLLDHPNTTPRAEPPGALNR